MMREEHGKHNEKLCDHLFVDGTFNDWVITTAFYSALHYAEGALFPIHRENVLYPTFSDYYSLYLRRRMRRRISKHAAVLNVVKDERPAAYASYKWLHDACMAARYVDFRVSKQKAETARRRLSRLKSCFEVGMVENERAKTA